MASDATARVACAMRLGGVLDHQQFPFERKSQDRVQVRRLAVKMRGDDRARAGRKRCLQPSGVEVMSPRVRLDGDGRCADQAHRKPGRDERVAGNNHLVARADLRRAQGEVKCVEAIGDPNAMLGFAIIRIFFFERRNFRPV